MKVDILNTYEELSQKAKDIIVQEIDKKRDILLCTATGGSPTKTYNLLGKEYGVNPERFDQLRILKLDEWGGIPMNHPATCESYLQTHLIQPLKISGSRYNGFYSNPADPVLECMNIQEKLDQEGPIDLCVLGLGMNGHLAFNEPADFLNANCHVAELSAMSLEHPMASEMQIKPPYGLTLGMADIMHSRMILILINGHQKKTIVSKFLSKKITSLVPASFLWLHPNVICLIEKDAIE
ncbi:MAG TPA: galactosamine-6-phosphate isomerase [Prolixibacteraceae bacterium]|nr:galactosamine-6-phosphate isomerase [Prolixibacteraceae bacterium]